MRGYLLKVFGIFLIVGVGELLLPDGNIKKYAKVLMSILVCHVLLSPIGVLPKFDIETEKINSAVEDTFDKEVLAEYKKRIEETVLKKCGKECEVILNDEAEIEKIIFYGSISAEHKIYIINELGVEESDIEIR